MESLNNISWGLIFSGFTLFLVMACVSEPVNIDLPQTHPANPTAQETAFIPPPNLFQNHMEMKSSAGSNMNEKKQTPSYQHQTEHKMDHMSKDSMSKPETGEEKQNHQH